MSKYRVFFKRRQREGTLDVDAESLNVVRRAFKASGLIITAIVRL